MHAFEKLMTFIYHQGWVPQNVVNRSVVKQGAQQAVRLFTNDDLYKK